jgi:hypothetical protein
MPIKLYVDLNSQPARSVYALCLANNVPFELVELNMMKGEVLISLSSIKDLSSRR